MAAVRRFPAVISERGVFITCGLAVPSAPKSLSRSVNFLIDTGACETSINEIETEKLEIDPRTLPRFERTVMTLGGAAPAFRIDDAFLLLLDDGDKTHEFPIPFVLVIEEPLGKKKRDMRYPMPNLIGRSFFKKYGLKFHVDFAKNEAFIEE